MKNVLKKWKAKTVKGFTLIEIKDSKILYTFHLIKTSLAVICTLFIRPLTIVF